ncbi:hypothetical protein L5515_009658 [Caenorhabditis briggsae]|uniref:SGNH domain-containing protein n=1 Tax=Caenorhabditis briggsae TaxID=6238 RepID=A0AAE9JQB5_CAEBR|nr:hypothetical protein L5515_009658 [Caenorhabditis briggsae]
MDSEEGCEPLAATSLFPGCDKKLEDFSALLKATRPHYAFILSRFYAVAEPFTNNNVQNIGRDLKKGVSPEEISKTLYTSDGYERGRLRHAALLKECFGKCEIIDYLPLLTRNFTVLPQFFDDSGISYFTSLGHLSAHGIELVRPIFRDICDKLQDR